MTNLTQLITELKEKAAKASEGTWRFGLDTPSRGYVHANKIIVADKVYVADGEYITACSPETIAVLCEALEDARELAEFYSILECEPVFGFEVNTTCLTKKARAFLAKYFPKGGA